MSESDMVFYVGQLFGCWSLGFGFGFLFKFIKQMGEKI